MKFRADDCSEPSEFNNFESLDLGQEWYEWTNLPFINAAWIIRKGFHKTKLDQILLESKQRGLNNIDDIVNDSINNFKLTKDELRGYLLKNIQYDLKVVSIKEKSLPEISDDFAKDLGEFNDLKDLKAEIKTQIRAVKENDVKGEMADEMILSGQKVIPEKLLAAGFQFKYQKVSDALNAIYS